MAIGKLPKDAMMLISFVNTRMRDEGIGLDDLCVQFEADRETLEETLGKIGYIYNDELKKFV
ncbi:MAG: DUF4250 domain-containing protein [Clostridium sp.]|nr:DUF4250 domain-containing protein [Clostridium sp.]MCM1398434.1 DUF4250 domain-containing protein [Clostridium sp.]MCM1458901.1 DUF4250 domain-containing protein [Bacteroides sp.]